MKMKKGFTLIELLAVIVILAIIALIAAPIVTMLIENTKQKSAELGANGYLDAFETKISTAVINRRTFSDGDYKIAGKYLSKYPILVDGEAPTAGDITVTNGKITEARLCVVGRSVNYDGTKTSKEETLNYCDGSVTFVDNLLNPNYAVYEAGDVLYFDPVLNDFCTQTDYTNNTNASVTGNVSGCMKWYVITTDDVKEKTYVNIMLDHNTTGTVQWNTSANNSSGPKIPMQELAADVATWNTSMTWKTAADPYLGKRVSDTYGYTNMYIASNVTTIKNYSGTPSTVTGTKARLITGEEVAAIVGIPNWSIGVNGHYLDNQSTSTAPDCVTNGTECTFGWLFDRTAATCETKGCSNNATFAVGAVSPNNSTSGYWTLSAKGNSSTSSFRVSDDNRLWNMQATGNFGIRPVISIEKELGE